MKKIFLIVSFLIFLSWNNASAVDIDFGTIVFTVGGGDLNATMDPTDGSINCNNSSNYECPAFGTPGTTLITGTTGLVADIACRSTARISDGTLVFDIGRSEVMMAGGTKVRCTGLNSVELTHTITGIAANDTIIWGGRLRIRDSGSSDYSGTFTSDGGLNARPQTIRVLFP